MKMLADSIKPSGQIWFLSCYGARPVQGPTAHGFSTHAQALAVATGHPVFASTNAVPFNCYCLWGLGWGWDPFGPKTRINWKDFKRFD